MKKTLALLLAALMLTGSLVACSGDTTTETNPPAVTPAEGEGAAAEETKAPEGEGAAAETEEPAEEAYVYVPSADNQYTGGVGVSQYGTSVAYSSIKVVNNADRQVLLDLSFDDAAELEGWNYFSRGSWDASKTSDWSVADGSLIFTDTSVNGASAWTGNTEWGNYNLTVKGKAVEGIEGLGVYFAVKDPQNYYYFNIGGWNNTKCCVEYVVNGESKSTTQIPITLTYGEEYTISVSVGKDVVQGYLDGEKLFQMGGEAPATINQGAVGFATWNTSVMFDNLKVVSNATGEVLYENTFDTQEQFDEIKHDLPAYSSGSFNGQDIFELSDGAYLTNDSSITGTVGYVGDPTWTNYTYTIDFMPVGGSEGASILYCVQPDVPKYSLINLGGWTNTKAAFQWYDAGTNTDNSADAVEFATTYDEWQTCTVVVLESATFIYVNGQLITSWWND